MHHVSVQMDTFSLALGIHCVTFVSMGILVPERALKKERESGLRRDFIAQRCGNVSIRYLGHVLSGRKKPSGPLLIVLSQILKTNPAYLTGKSDVDGPSKEQVA